MTWPLPPTGEREARAPMSLTPRAATVGTGNGLSRFHRQAQGCGWRSCLPGTAGLTPPHTACHRGPTPHRVSPVGPPPSPREGAVSQCVQGGYWGPGSLISHLKREACAQLGQQQPWDSLRGEGRPVGEPPSLAGSLCSSDSSCRSSPCLILFPGGHPPASHSPLLVILLPSHSLLLVLPLPELWRSHPLLQGRGRGDVIHEELTEDTDRPCRLP